MRASATPDPRRAACLRAAACAAALPFLVGATCRRTTDPLVTVLQNTLLFEGRTIAEVPPSDLHPLETNDYMRFPLDVPGSSVKRAPIAFSFTDCGPWDAEFARCGWCGGGAVGRCGCPSVANMDRRMIELRGWLRRVDSACASDHDARYDLEVDPEWTDSIGLTDLNALVRVGNVLLTVDPGDRAVDPAPATFWAAASRPIIHLEVHPWRPGEHSGPPPASWLPASAIGDYCPDGAGDFWPYDPRTPLRFRPTLDAAKDQYVRVVGALITDSPHFDTGGLFRNTPGAPPCWALGANHERRGSSSLEVCQLNEVRHAWAGDQFVGAHWVNMKCETDQDHPARWTEMHPVDFIGVLDPKPQVETVRVVAVAAENGFWNGRTETLELELRPPDPRPEGGVVDVREFVDEVLTNRATIREHTVDVRDDHVKVRVAVRGESRYRAKGKFKAVYRVRWKSP